MRALLLWSAFVVVALTVVPEGAALRRAAAAQTASRVDVAALVTEYRSGDAEAAIAKMAAIDEATLRRLVSERPLSSDPWQLAALALLHAEAGLEIDLIDAFGEPDRRQSLHSRRWSELIERHVCQRHAMDADAAISNLCRHFAHLRGFEHLAGRFKNEPFMLMRRGMSRSPGLLARQPPAYRLGNLPEGDTSASLYRCEHPTSGGCNDSYFAAARDFAAVLERDPMAAEARLRRGLVLLFLRQHGEAARELGRAAADARATKDRWTEYLAELAHGQLQEERGRPAEALVRYRAAHQAAPEFSTAAIALARLESMMGRRAEAGEILTRALAPDRPRPVDPWLEFFELERKPHRERLSALRAEVRR